MLRNEPRRFSIETRLRKPACVAAESCRRSECVGHGGYLCHSPVGLARREFAESAGGCRLADVGCARVAAKDEQAALAPQSPVLSNIAAEKDIQALSTLRPPAANSAAVDGRPQAPPAQPTLSEIGAAVIKGREAPSALQITPDASIAVIRGAQAPSALPVAPDNSATVVRGK